MQLLSIAGSRVFIGHAYPFGRANVPGIHASAWVEIGGATGLGRMRRDWETVVLDDILHPQMVKKGKARPASMIMSFDLDFDDAGQLALIAAENDGKSRGYGFRIDFNDAGPEGLPTRRLFIAAVLSIEEVYEEATETMKLIAELAVNSEVLREARA